MHRKHLLPSLLASTVITLGATRATADSPGSVTIQALAGPQVFQHEFPNDGKPAQTETIGDVLKVAEQVAVTYQWTKILQPSFAVQSTQALTKPNEEEPSRFTSVQVQPGLGVSLGQIFAVGLDAVLSPRSGGRTQFAFGLQSRVCAKFQIGGNFSIITQVQMPLMLIPDRSTQLQPLVGLGYQFGG